MKTVYEHHPYPPRKKEDVFKRGYLSTLPIINAIFWGGKRDLDNCVFVDVGCGTGDNTMDMADHLRETSAKVIGLDISKSALDIAKERAKRVGLENIEWIEGSLLNIEEYGISADYLICCSVLPHLDNPDEGFAVLSKAIKKDGGAGFKIYGKYGRWPVHLMQKVWGVINRNVKDEEERFRNAAQIVSLLPSFHPYKRIPVKYTIDLRYDALLLNHTKPYSVLDIYETLDKAGLKLVRFREMARYRPETYLGNRFEKQISSLDEKEYYHLGEMLNGTIPHHTFFACPRDFTPFEQNPENEEAVPFFPRSPASNFEAVPPDKSIVIDLKRGRMNYRIIVPPQFREVFSLINGENKVKDVLEELRAKDEEKAERFWKTFSRALVDLDLLFLKRP